MCIYLSFSYTRHPQAAPLRATRPQQASFSPPGEARVVAHPITPVASLGRVPSGGQVALNALVAGGAGMIGSHLCEALLKGGHRVVCLDNLSTGRAGNLADFARDPAFTFIRHDVTLALPDVGRVDRVYHLASPAS